MLLFKLWECRIARKMVFSILCWIHSIGSSVSPFILLPVRQPPFRSAKFYALYKLIRIAQHNVFIPYIPSPMNFQLRKHSYGYANIYIYFWLMRFYCLLYYVQREASACLKLGYILLCFQFFTRYAVSWHK